MNVLETQMVINLITTGVVIVSFLLLRWVIHKALIRRIPSLDTRHLWKQITNYALLLTAATLLSHVWFEGIGAALTVLSLIAAALTIIHKELILNLTTWSVILWRSLFGLGDRVQVGTFAGDVVDLGLLYFTLAEVDIVRSGQHTGRMIKVPNSLVLTQAVLNFTAPFQASWFELPVVLTSDSDWEAGERLLLEVATDVLPTPTPSPKPDDAPAGFDLVTASWEPTITTHVVDGKLTLSLRYACSPDQQAALVRHLWRALLQRVDMVPDVKLALAPPPAAANTLPAT